MGGEAQSGGAIGAGKADKTVSVETVGYLLRRFFFSRPKIWVSVHNIICSLILLTDPLIETHGEQDLSDFVSDLHRI